MHRTQLFSRIGIAAFLLAGFLLLLPFLCARIFPLATHYASVHPKAEVPPMLGLAEDSVFNVGTPEMLDRFPGIGPVLSQRIVDVRTRIGGYRLPEDLLLVKGIGDKTLAGMMAVLEEPLAPLLPLGE